MSIDCTWVIEQISPDKFIVRKHTERGSFFHKDYSIENCIRIESMKEFGHPFAQFKTLDAAITFAKSEKEKYLTAKNQRKIVAVI